MFQVFFEGGTNVKFPHHTGAKKVQISAWFTKRCCGRPDFGNHDDPSRWEQAQSSFVFTNFRAHEFFVYIMISFYALNLTPQREAGDVWCLPPVWNLRAVMWFHFAISSLVLLPSPVTLSVLSITACWPFLLNFFQKIVQYLSLRDSFFVCGPCLAVRRSELVGGMCSMLPYDTGICYYAFM